MTKPENGKSWRAQLSHRVTSTKNPVHTYNCRSSCDETLTGTHILLWYDPITNVALSRTRLEPLHNYANRGPSRVWRKPRARSQLDNQFGCRNQSPPPPPPTTTTTTTTMGVTRENSEVFCSPFWQKTNTAHSDQTSPGQRSAMMDGSTGRMPRVSVSLSTSPWCARISLPVWRILGRMSEQNVSPLRSECFWFLRT